MTEFKPGACVNVSLVGAVDQSGRPRFGYDDRRLCNIEGEAMGLDQLRRDYDATITPHAVPYTDPIADLGTGARLRVVVEGVTTGTPGFPDLRDDQGRILLSGAQLAEAATDGRVSLVKAAAPQYQPGRIYRSPGSLRRDDPQALAERWYYTGADGQPWWLLRDNGAAPLPIEAGDEAIPADLVLCDVVPAQVKP